MYSQAIRILSKGYLSISLLPPSKVNIILQEVKEVLQVTDRDYDLVIKRLYHYYDMKLVTFGIDNQRNPIIQFLVFVQPYTQQHLTLYQMETVLVPIVDENKQAQSHTFENKETIYSIKFRDIYFIENARTGYMQKDRL